MSLKFTTEETIVAFAKELVGETYGTLADTVDGRRELSKGKSKFGDLIEACYGIEKNSLAAPDFTEAGIELKVTPVIKAKSKKAKYPYRAKERLVCNMIDYMAEAKIKQFTDSSFYKKCAQVLIFFYEYCGSEVELRLWPLKAYSLMKIMELPIQDQMTIIEDWAIIHRKICAGLAHEISEADTCYLAACPKGANASALRHQPHSKILAMSRAYSLKSTYMTVYYNRVVLHDKGGVSLYHRVVPKPLEKYVADVTRPYIGKTLRELCEAFGVNANGKAAQWGVFLAMFRVQNADKLRVEEFEKAGIEAKTVRVRKNGMPKEAMSFPKFVGAKLLAESSWEESDLYHRFADTRYMFVIFREDASGEYRFSGCRFWCMPYGDLNGSVRKVWERTRATLRSGQIYVPNAISPSGRRKTNFVKISDNLLVHVRPHGRDSRDVDNSLGVPFTKSCFWLNQDYVKGILDEHQ